MRVNLSSAINASLPGVVLISHGAFAEGICQSLGMILGESENIATVCLAEDEADVDTFGEKIAETVSSFPAGAIVLIDLFGGTPFNQYLLHVKPDVSPAVCGLNLGMLLEVVSSREDVSLQELAKIAAGAGAASVINVADRLRKAQNPD